MKKTLALLALVLLFGNNASSQEWEYSLNYYADDDKSFSFVEAKELSNGNICVASIEYYKSGAGDFYSCHPAVSLFSPKGEEIAREVFFKEGYNTMSYTPYLFEKNGSLYALMSYSPDHDSTYFNYFKNYDNPPTDAIVGLYKLNNDLSIEESHEYSYPIDTTECRDCMIWEILPNEISGYIYIFSAFEDEGDIIAAYLKCDSHKKNSSDATLNDSLVFMRMNFEGEIINRKAHLIMYKQNLYHDSFRRNHIIQTDSFYALYGANYLVAETDIIDDGAVEYFDKDFNYIKVKNIEQPIYNLGWHRLQNISVVRSDHNTTYLAVTSTTINPEYCDHYKYEDNRLYELDDNVNNISDDITILNYIVRGTDVTRDRQAIMQAADIAKDGSIYYAYSMNLGEFEECDSWIVIERLDSEMDTIATYFYGSDNDNMHDDVDMIKATKDGGVIIVCDSYNVPYSPLITKKIVKFPATVFGFEPDNIEEAHANNLHLAVAYPNPGGDVMNIRCGLRNAILQVYDINGRKIHEEEITDDVTSIDASGWQSGTYIWKLGMRNEELGMKEVESGKWIK